MAKKKAAATAEPKKPETVEGKKGAGWRFHDECGYSTKGPRSTTCGKCGEPFPQKAKKPKGKRQTTNGAIDVPSILAASKLIATAGSVAKARKAFEEVAAVANTL